MRFVDSNIFIYAFFLPNRQLKREEQQLKEKSKKIIEKIDKGERVATTVINLSEVANVLKTCFSPADLSDLFQSLLIKENITVFAAHKNDWLSGTMLSKKHEVKLNDCFVAHVMRSQKLKEIYTFDEDFKKFDWLKIVN